MDEATYHRISDQTLNSLADVLEEADARGDLEVEYQDGILTIILESGKQLLVSKHGVTKQLWLSSPMSGGLHFVWDGSVWALADKRVLEDVLANELKQLAQLDISFT
ncbi:MAG: iron donor protein CyaY [Rickettsiales bacterium]